VLLIALWVRSYSALESWLGWRLHIQSSHGKIIVFEVPDSQKHKAVLRKVAPGYNGYSKVSFDKFKPSTELSFGIAGSQTVSARFYGERICIIPFWAAILVTALLPVGSWIKWNWQFSLRTLLIATTLIAVVLGLIVWTVR
jgi:hypothetical protein